MQIRAFEEGDTDSVVALWRLCGLTRPWNDPHTDIARKLAVQRELFLVGVDEVGAPTTPRRSPSMPPSATASTTRSAWASD